MVTNYGEGAGGGLQKRRGGGMWTFAPAKRGGRHKEVLAMLTWGHKKFWGIFYAVA